MTDTTEHDDPAPRSAGLAGGAARALRAARQSTPTPTDGTVADETLAPVTSEALGPDDGVDADRTDADKTTAAGTAKTTAAGTDIEQTTADEPTNVSTAAGDGTEDTVADPSDDPDASPVLATVRSPKRTGTRARVRRTEPAAPVEAKDTTRSRLLAASALLTAAALVFAVVAGVLWWRAGHDETRDAAAARVEVAVDARLAIATVNTSDYRKAGNALTNWIDVATGSLEKQFTTSRASATTLLAQAKKVTTATVLDVAVTKLDGRSATVIASVNVRQQPASGAASTVRNRFRASMTKVGDEWKLADLAQVDVQIS